MIGRIFDFFFGPCAGPFQGDTKVVDGIPFVYQRLVGPGGKGLSRWVFDKRPDEQRERDARVKAAQIKANTSDE